MKKKPHLNQGPNSYQKSKSASKEHKEKVAESVTAYVPAIKHSIAGIPVSEEVWRFVTKHNLIPYLETAIGLIQESFHEIREIELCYDIDPEIENESWITLLVKAGGTTSELLQEHMNYKKSMRKLIPLSKLPLIRLFLGVN